MNVNYRIDERTEIDPPGKQITFYIVETEEIVGTRTVYLDDEATIASAESQLPQFQANPYWLMGPQ